MSYKIYTRTGDSGTTGLYGSARVDKDSARIELIGVIDELNSFIGHSISISGEFSERTTLVVIQNLLFNVGAEIATDTSDGNQPSGKNVYCIDLDDVEMLETAIDNIESKLEPLRQFILPGGTVVAATLHQARAVCRRAERRCLTLARSESVSQNVIVFLNRLSDYLFVSARLANSEFGEPDVCWSSNPRKPQ